MRPDHVALIADDPELAGEVGGHTYALAGAVGGFVLGGAVAVLYVVMGGPSFLENPPGVVLGAAFVAFGLAFIGNVLGRAVLVHAAHHDEFMRAVEEGGAVVTVECVGEECDHARHLLPVAPVAPVGPVAPVAPVAPVGPWVPAEPP